MDENKLIKVMDYIRRFSEENGYTPSVREIRRMFEAIGKNVSFLKRIKIGTLTLSGLDRGKIRPLTDGEVSALKIL